MKGLIFYSEIKLKVINPEVKEKESRKSCKLPVGKEVEGRVGLLIY